MRVDFGTRLEHVIKLGLNSGDIRTKGIKFKVRHLVIGFPLLIKSIIIIKRLEIK